MEDSKEKKKRGSYSKGGRKGTGGKLSENGDEGKSTASPR